MADPDSGVEWDDTVDVICVGTSPGVLAYALCCATDDRDVMIVNPPEEPDPLTVAWYAAMTEDLSPTVNPGRASAGEGRQGFSFARVAPMPELTGKRVKMETFVGEHLRQWSAQCLRSPLGVVFTEVPELLVLMRADDAESITAALIGDLAGVDLLTWITDRCSAAGVTEPESRMAAMVVEDGRIAGVELTDGSLIAATGGLAFPVEAGGVAVPDPPSGHDCTVALVGRPAGRFAMVDLLYR